MPVQFVDSQQMANRPIHIMIYGPTRVGKTTAAASAPRPIFLSVAMEGGDTTLRMLPNVRVAQIGSTADMVEAIDQIARNPTICDTVVVDSISFYCDLFIHEIVTKNRGPMKQKDWGLLDNHVMKFILPKLRRLPQHVIWIALEQESKDGDSGVVTRIEPMLYGKQAAKLPAATDLIIRMSQRPFNDPQTGRMKMVPVFLTTPQGPYIAGGRFGDAFSDGVLWPTWQAIHERIGNYIGVRGAPRPYPRPQPQPQQPQQVQPYQQMQQPAPAYVPGPSYPQGQPR